MPASVTAPSRIEGGVIGAAVELDRQLEMRLVEREFRAPGPDEVRIRVEWTGISGSNLTVARTGRWVEYWPAVQGHEVFGRIDAVGAGVDLAPGIAVVVDSRFPCGDCAQCALDRDRCLRRSYLGERRPGGFATHCLLPAVNVLPAGEVDGSIAVMAESLACALHAINHLAHPPRRAAVLGYGAIGALVHLALRMKFPDVEVTVAEAHPMRAKLALALGAAVSGDALTDRSFDAVFDAGCHNGALPVASQLCNDEGRVVVIARASDSAIVPSALVERELIIRGSHSYAKELPDALRMISQEPQMFRPLVSEAIDLSELPAVIRREIQTPRGCKVVVRP